MVKYKKVIYYSTKVRGGGGAEASAVYYRPSREIETVFEIGSSKQMTGNKEISKWKKNANFTSTQHGET